ncbi:MAG TPA: glycosyltransferase family 39 protein [Ktedonobacterales bacterium]
MDDETMSRFTFSTIIRRAGAALAAAPAASPLARWRHLLDVRRGALLAAGIAVVALNVVFHTVHLASAPGWDPQEGYNLDLAWNLVHGRWRLFALTSAFGQHPPLFYLQLAVLIHVLGYSIATIRALAGAYAILTCVGLLGLGWRLLGAGPALWAGLVYTCAPFFLANTRWGYSYSQLMFVTLLCVWALWRYAESRRKRWLIVAALVAGFAVLSDYEGIALVALVALFAWTIHRRDVLLAVAVSLALPVIGLVVGLVAAPHVFGADLLDTFGRATGASPLLSIVEALINYYRAVTLDVWIVLGMVGLLLVRAPRVRAVLWPATGLLGLFILTVREIGPSFHTALPLIPLLALGTGVALDGAVRQLYAWAAGAQSAAPPRDDAQTDRIAAPWLRVRARNAAAALVVFVVVISPLAIALAGDAAGLATTLPTRDDAVLATAPQDAQAAAGYVLAHARPGDLTLGSPQVVWMLDQPEDARGRTRPLYSADLLQTLAYQGRAAAFYPAGLPPQRWAYAVSLGRARYVIVDDLLRRLAAPGQVDGLAQILAAVETWPLVYHHGEYALYERPHT